VGNGIKETISHDLLTITTPEFVNRFVLLLLMESPNMNEPHLTVDEKLVPHQHVEQHSGLGAASFENTELVATKKKIEKRLVLKQDLTMLPLLGLCFFFSYVVGYNIM
jgi:hypothetical protein